MSALPQSEATEPPRGRVGRNGALVREQIAPYGEVSVPGRSRWQLRDLMREVREYFDLGATVRSGDVVFDVGANIGAFAIEAARRCDGEVRLYGFEPVPDIFDALLANATDNTWLSTATTQLFEVALVSELDPPRTDVSFFRRLPTDSTCDIGAKRRDFEMFFAEKGAAMRRSLSPRIGTKLAGAVEHLVSSVPRVAVGRAAIDFVLGRERLQARTATLSSVIREREVDRIDLLKVDVEGAELRVLQGIAAEHWPLIEQIVLEGHDHGGRLEEIRSLLVEQDMNIERVCRPDGAEERGLDSFLIHARRSSNGSNGHGNGRP